MAYNLTTEWVKGSTNNAPDALSRNPVSDPEPTDTLAELGNNDNSECLLLRSEPSTGKHQTAFAYKSLESMLEMTLSINNYETLF